MKIYFVYDGWEEFTFWETKFYATKELAEEEVRHRIEKLHAEEEANYERKIQAWSLKDAAKKAVIDAGLPLPAELSWLEKPTKKKFVNNGIEVDYVEVIESEG